MDARVKPEQGKKSGPSKADSAACEPMLFLRL
jgi:hypothetical protein